MLSHPDFGRPSLTRSKRCWPAWGCIWHGGAELAPDTSRISPKRSRIILSGVDCGVDGYVASSLYLTTLTIATYHYTAARPKPRPDRRKGKQMAVTADLAVGSAAMSEHRQAISPPWRLGSSSTRAIVIHARQGQGLEARDRKYITAATGARSHSRRLAASVAHGGAEAMVKKLFDTLGPLYKSRSAATRGFFFFSFFGFFLFFFFSWSFVFFFFFFFFISFFGFFFFVLFCCFVFCFFLKVYFGRFMFFYFFLFFTGVSLCCILRFF